MANYRVSTNTNNRTKAAQDKKTKNKIERRKMKQPGLLKLKQTIII
jgi:hypothetical protein